MRKEAILLALLVPACGGYPAPIERLATSEASIRGAQEVGAKNEPRAALHLKLAQEQLTQAQKLMKDGDNERADFVLQRATSDAELAVSLAKESAARDEAQQALDQATKLKAKLQ